MYDVTSVLVLCAEDVADQSCKRYKSERRRARDRRPTREPITVVIQIYAVHRPIKTSKWHRQKVW